jgi:hypothetical protein
MSRIKTVNEQEHQWEAYRWRRRADRLLQELLGREDAGKGGGLLIVFSAR